MKACLNLNGLRRALTSLPKTLDDTYTRILCHIDETHYQYALKILQWLVYSARPLTLAELAEVIVIDVEGSPRCDPANRFPEPRDILKICSNLVALDSSVLDGMDVEKDDGSAQVVIRLAHFSVKEYLVSERILQGNARRYNIQEISANISIYNDCLAYLLEFELFDHCSTSQCLAEFPLADYAAKYWTKHAQIAEKHTGFNPNLTRELLLTKEDGLLNLVRLHNPEWPQGTVNPYLSLREIHPPLYYVSMAGLHKSVQMLLDEGVNVNAQGGKHGNALHVALEKGHIQIVQMLLDKGANFNALHKVHGTTLQIASVNGHIRIVQLLLDKGVDINAYDKKYGNALQSALAGGQLQVVQMLLDKGADVNAPDGKYGNALLIASERGHTYIVQILLDKGADVNASDGKYGNALLIASERGHIQIMEILLDKGANINAPDMYYGTILQRESFKGHIRIVQILLDKGVDVNVRGGAYCNALQAASIKGYIQIVQMLLDKGADVNAQGGEYGNALHAASKRGHTQVMQMLLRNGAIWR